MTDAYVLETMLLRWSDSHTGRTVTLLLPDEGDHPFKGLKCGPANGQRLAISVALIADDETVHHTPGSKKAEKAQSECPQEPERKPKSRAQMAGRLCNDPVFVAFMAEEFGYDPAEDPAWMVRDQCRVDSRAAFDEDVVSAGRWDDLYFQYQAWRAAGK